MPIRHQPPIREAAAAGGWTADTDSPSRALFIKMANGEHVHVDVTYTAAGIINWATLDGRIITGTSKLSRVVNFLRQPYNVAATEQLIAAAQPSPFRARDNIRALGESAAAALFTTYDVGVTLVAQLDNGGQPCEHCQLIGHTIQVQAYGTTYKHHPCGESIMVESCMPCLPAALVHAEVDNGQSLRLEITESTAR